jgi:small Trp-rich protein
MVVIGILLVVAKLAEFGPFERWSWWIILAPFALAAVWWQFADASGLTKRRAMDKMEARKTDRRDKALEALGLNTRRQKIATKVREAKARAVSADPTLHEPPPPAPPRRDPRL